MSINDYAAILGKFSPETESISNTKMTKIVPDKQHTIVDFADITQKESSYGDRPVIIPTAGYHQAKEEDDKYRRFAMIIRRRIDDKRRSMGVMLEINSTIIQQSIRDVLGYYPGVNLLSDPITFLLPYVPLFHFRSELISYAESDDRSTEEKSHLQLLTQFVKVNMGKAIRDYEAMVCQGYISFDLLSQLFRPGQLVVTAHDELKECYYVLYSFVHSLVGVETKVHKVMTICWRFDGEKFGPRNEELEVIQYRGVRHIHQLEAVPLCMLPDAEQISIKDSLIKRGHQWRRLVGVSHCEYNGQVWLPDRSGSDSSSNEESGDESNVRHVASRVILDHKTYYQHNGAERIFLEATGRLIDIDDGNSRDIQDVSGMIQQDQERMRQVKLRKDPALEDISRIYQNTSDYTLSQHQAILCPATIPGYALADKIWCEFQVDQVQTIKWNDEAFKSLEIDAHKKRVIKTLVEIHQKSQSTFDDIVAGKGKGLIFSLHGPPGGGKTLTAETIAEYTHQPLLCITSGDLGTFAEKTDDKLRIIFSLSKAWKAIVLLDEADVFLSRRSNDDILRNAFVSIFLRSMEWFQGILFLTSNRPEEFDAAFQSRIHLSLYYPALNGVRRTVIWKNFLQGHEAARNWGTEVFERLGHKYELNGREIKNLVSLAMSICIENGSPLSEEVLEMLFLMNKSGKDMEDSSGTGLLSQK